MKSMITAHPYGALSIPATGPEERLARGHEDLARIDAIDPEQLPLALAFLSGYYPAVFYAVLEAVEPCDGTDTSNETDQEPFCLKCNAPVGVFLAHGSEYRHYRGIITATSKPRPYRSDHTPVVGWRPVVRS